MRSTGPRPSLRLGRHAGRFVLEELLGAGGNGSVHRAYDRKLGLEVALKIPHRFDAEGLLSLKREFRVLSGLTHPNLLALHELFVGDASWFFTMDLVDGTDVLTFLDRRGLGRAEDRAALAGIVDGLLALHEAGVVHRDLKPSNAWIDRSGQAVLLDFGLASLATDASGAVAGTTAYLAPELLRGAGPSPETDGYALGVLLFEALTRTPLFDGSTPAVLGRKLTSDAPSALGRSGDAPVELVRLVDGLLARDPAQRPSLRDVRRALIGAEAPSTVVTGRAAEPPPFVGREASIAALHEAFLGARDELRVVRLLGPPGIGKSALLAELRAGLERGTEPAIVITGRCSEHETVAFAVLDEAMDALAKILRKESEEPLVRAALDEITTVAEAFPALALAIPEDVAPVARAVSSAEPRERRRRVAEAVRAILDRLAAKRRVALLLDDVQWADEDGTSLLVEMLRSEGARGLFVVLSQRDDEGPAHAAAFGAIQGTVDLVVPPLAPEDARALAAHFGGDASADRVARAAGGSPFLLEALARVETTLDQSGSPETPNDLATRAISLRVASLSAAARALLETSALAGHPLALDTARAAVAGGASPPGPVDIGALRRLESLRLVRVRSPRRGAIELVPYHDRVREIVVRAVPLGARQRAHGALARALEARGEADLLLLCMHYREAAELDRAAGLAELGAAEALSHLAFARAVELYQFALAHRPRDARARELRVALGDALVSAGRSADAADAFLHALEDTVEADARLDLRRRAAEQLLRVGHFRRGVAMLDEVLVEAGVPIRRSPALALLSLVRRRSKLVRLAVSERPARDASALDRVELRRIDACVSGAMGLSVVDSLRSADLMSEALSRAIEHGDGRRLAVCTLWQAAFAANEGGPGEARTRALLARGTTLGERHGGAYERGCVRAASALTEFHLGNFQKALGHTLVGERIFLDETRGTRKESATMQIFSLASQAMLGEISSLSRRVELLERDATERGDRYATTNVRQGLPLLRWLARDEPGRAHEDLDRAMHGFDASGYTVQHFFDLLGRVVVLLYEGRVEEARRRYETDRFRLARSLLSRTQWTRVHAGLLDVWTALALARQQSGLARERLLLPARARVLRMGREDRPWARAITEAMSAQIAGVGGRSVDARARAEAALPALDASELGLYAGLTRVALGSPDGAAWAEANGICRPERLARVVFPFPAVISAKVAEGAPVTRSS